MILGLIIRINGMIGTDTACDCYKNELQGKAKLSHLFPFSWCVNTALWGGGKLEFQNFLSPVILSVLSLFILAF